MKLIIDIPKEVYEEAKTSGLPYMYDELVASAVSDGTPFDSVIEDIKAEIKAKEVAETDIVRQFYNMALNDVYEIFDNIGTGK